MMQSHVISWNLTKRCNLLCEHCYISAGRVTKEEADGELSTEECLDLVDQLADLSPEALLILTGGEPLLRPDLFEIAQHAHERGFWVVVGTNGVKLRPELCDRMVDAGVKGVALSLDSMRPHVHDLFRKVQGAWQNTIDGSAVLRDVGLPFIVQTTVGLHNIDEIEQIAELAESIGARVFNLYFLVPTGRGTYVSDITPEQYESVLERLRPLQERYSGRMLVNSKCAPHYQRVLYHHDSESPFLKAYADGAGGCPAGTHYMGIRPDGQVTPCPYLPVYGGSIRETPLREIWESSSVFEQVRRRSDLSGRCGGCEFSQLCGGCRARAFGSTGDVLAEDPWCAYQPPTPRLAPIRLDQETTYGLGVADELEWTPEASHRLRQVPSFVRGMVSKRVEAYARERGLEVVTAELMHEVRSEVMGGRIGNAPAFVRRMLQDREL